MSLFSVEQVKLEAACASVSVWREGLVLGCTNGTAYTVTQNDGAWELSRSSVRLSRHPLIHCVVCTQQQPPPTLPPSSPHGPGTPTATEEASVISEASTQKPQQEDRMVAITDEGVTVFALPSFALKGQAFRTRGAAALCWHSAWQLLAVARPGGIGKANQVEFFSFQGRELHGVWKCNTPDTVTHMLWLNNTLLCCGPVGLCAITVSISPQCSGKLKEVMKWRQRCRCSLAATGDNTAAVFHDQTISYFRLSEGKLSAPWRWEPSSSGAEFLEYSDNRQEVLTRTPSALLHWQPYMLIAGLPGQFQMHLSTLEAAHFDLVTWNLPEAAEESDAMSMSSVSSHIGWGRAMRRAATAAGGVMLAGGTPPPGMTDVDESEQALGDEAGPSSYRHHPSEVESSVIAAARFGSKTLQVMRLLPLEDQIECLVELGKVREALALCSACGEAGDDFTDGLRVALGVQLCDGGDLDIGLLEIASASKMYPLAILQYFPTLISNPEATLATMARKHMSAATRELLGFGLPPGTPRPVTFHPLPQSQPGGPPQGALSMVASTAEYSTEYGTPQATPGTPRTSDGSSRADLDKAAASTPLCSYLEAGNHNNGGTPILEEEDSAPILQEESSAAVSTGLIDTPMQSSPLQPGLVGGFWADNDDDDGGMFGGWGGVVAAEKAAEEASQAGSQDGTMSGAGRKLEGVAVALPYLVTFRSRMLVRKSQEGAVAASDKEAEGRAREVVDMALLHGWLQVADYAALLGLMTQPNAVPLSDGREALATEGLYVELIQLLQNHGHHPEAMDVYRLLSDAPSDLDPPPRGVSAGLTGRLAAGQSLTYLMRVPDDDEAVPLICQSLETWLLKADPDGSVDVLINRKPPIPPDEALAALRTAAPALSSPYLEAAISTNIAAPEKFHTPLACMYLATLVSQAPSRRSSPHATPINSLGQLPHQPQTSQTSNLPESSGTPRTPTASGPRLTPRVFRTQTSRSPYASRATEGTGRFGSNTRLSVAAAMSESESSVLQKLLTLIRDSPHLDGEELQRHLPADSTNRNVLVVKGALHERQFQHGAAMRVYAHMMRDPMQAEAFADRLYDMMVVRAGVMLLLNKVQALQ